MSHRVHEGISLAGANPLLIFPNGCKFNATDVFVGSGRIHNVEVSAVNPIGALAQTVLQCFVYDCLSVATGRIYSGGTTTQETYRLAVGAQTLGSYGEPVVEGALPADVLALRPVISHLIQLTPEVTRVVIPVEHDCVAGMVVILTNVIGAGPGVACALKATYTPWVTGGTRRRRAYQPGDTTKLANPAQTNIPL